MKNKVFKLKIIIIIAFIIFIGLCQDFFEFFEGENAKIKGW